DTPRPESSRRRRARGRAPPSKRHLRALFLDAPGLVVPPRERSGLADLDGDADAESDPDVVGQLRAKPVALGEREGRRRIDTDQDVVEPLVTPEDDLELVDVGVRPHQLLHAPRIDDDTTHLLHVVEPGQHPALERDERAPARTPPVGQLDEVARPVADERHRLPVEAREDQLAPLAGADRLIPFVEDLGIAVVLVPVGEPGTSVALEAPRRDLGEPGQVVGLRAERGLDLRPRGWNGRAGLAGVPGDAYLRVLGEVDALLRRRL